MGEAVLSAFMEMVFSKASSYALEEIELVRGFKEELEKLKPTLLTINDVLSIAEEKQITDPAVRHWLLKLKDIAYDADDILDEYAARALQARVEGEAQTSDMRQVRAHLPSCLSSNPWLSRRNLAVRIRGVRRILGEIAVERRALSLMEGSGEDTLAVAQRPQTGSLINKKLVVGRKQDKENLIQMLLASNRSSGHHVSCIPIVGMGGMGKTTLAKLVYNDQKVERHFKQKKMWVSVSFDFDVNRLTRAIIESLTGVSPDLTELDALQQNLIEELKDKRFLLVLDDVWNNDRDDWETLCAPLNTGGRGSVIIVTTQYERVADLVSTEAKYSLKRLSDNECWLLFKKCAFVDGNSDGYPRLEEVGRDIVKKLGGLPLAAKTLGSLLYANLNENEWRNILDSELWELGTENNILPYLRLSYQRLPAHLKQCFAYCSLLHKNCVLGRDDLIQIWMAQNFIKPRTGVRMEDEGNKYLKELFSRSFFQYDIENKHFYVMHNLIHDLAQSLTIDECLRIEEGKKCRFSRKARHLSLFSIELEPSLFQEFCRLRRLRTLALLPGQTPSIIRIPDQLFTKLRCLRVLLFSGGWLEELPDSIGNLKQLRFLGLFQCNIKELPRSLSQLYNLQTLRLNQCHRLHKLPRDFRNLINLRHLEAEPELVSSIAGIGKLTSIQQLDTFLVRRDEGHQISELQHMTELRGKLQITGLENVTSLEEAQLSGLKNKLQLRTLELEWNADYGDHEPALEGLQPHNNIEYLTINCYRGVRFPNWMGNPLFKNLVNISLQKCRKCEFLPPLGQLPYLKTLEILEMHEVTKVGQEFFGDGNVKGFPSLEALMFYDLPNWEQWSLVQPGPIFPCLQKLGIWTCPKLKELPCLPVQLRDLEVSQAGCVDMRTKSRHSSLDVTGCPELLFLPQDGLATIKRLKIMNCQDLTRLPFGDLSNLNSLRHLEISGCAQLTLFPHQGLPTELKFLKICDCVNLGSLTGKLLDLLSLRELVIHDCPSLTSLPDELLTLPNLKKRNIMNCPNLKPPSSPAS